MALEIRKYLFDLPQACQPICALPAGQTLRALPRPILCEVRRERQFLTIGAAFPQAVMRSPPIRHWALRSTDVRKIVAFRNVLPPGSYVLFPMPVVWALSQPACPGLPANSSST